MNKGRIGIMLTVMFCVLTVGYAFAQDEELPVYLTDRGTGVPSSMFATFMETGHLITYLFYEFYLDNTADYNPDDFGYDEDKDYWGRSIGHEGLIFLGYGVTDWLALELEAAIIKETLYKSSKDKSDMPNEYSEAGLGDVESQIRLRWLKEKQNVPEMFSYFEVVFPLQKHRDLIGTQDWELKLGTGVTKGFSFGTFTLRGAVEYAMEDEELAVGEFALEYIKRLSPHWRIYLGVEGDFESMELITEAQWHIVPDKVILKLNNAFGLTQESEDWAPEVGVMAIW